MPQNTPKPFFFSLKNFKKNNLLICKLYGFKSLTIMTFMIVLKQHVWEKSGSRVNAKMLLANQISGFLNLKISKTIGGIKWVFLHAALYLIKVISWSYKFRWVWSGMTKEAFKTLISQKLIEVESWFCACNFIFCQLSCHVGISEWIYTL